MLANLADLKHPGSYWASTTGVEDTESLDELQYELANGCL